MKFGLFLQQQKDPTWDSDAYIQYDKLKELIEIGIESQDRHGRQSSAHNPTVQSLSVQKNNTKPYDLLSQFYIVLEGEMAKIEKFTLDTVADIRNRLKKVEADCAALVMINNSDENEDEDEESKLPSSSNDLENSIQAITREIDFIADRFLKLEQFCNLNYEGFQKILKKHDKRLENPCRGLYSLRFKGQAWVRGDYSDIIVAMSKVYSLIRRDAVLPEKHEECQTFFRRTRKYWVRSEDISKVKYILLQNLPVFLQKGMQSGTTDSQLVNSVYCDNEELELYTGRLEKNNGAIALRFRWYGDDISKVFVERKTHRDSTSVLKSEKERFIVPESQVLSILQGKFDVAKEVARMKANGKSDKEIEAYRVLATEVCDVIVNKKLVPTMRTQYTRTAFQIPFDASVRVSMDTNLCFILDKTIDTMEGVRWYRNPDSRIYPNEINYFPHAVLEIKLQLKEEDDTPTWLVDLINSGMLVEKHKFSKYIQGCASIIPASVSAFPYWIDDPSLQASIAATRNIPPNDRSQEKYKIFVNESSSSKSNATSRDKTLNKIRRSIEGSQPHNGCTTALKKKAFSCVSYLGFHFETYDSAVSEPKIFMANERTFISWLSMATILTSISIAVLAFSENKSFSMLYGLALLPIAFLFVIYALNTYIWRGKNIRNKASIRWDDPHGPIYITCAMIVALVGQLIIKIFQLRYNVTL